MLRKILVIMINGYKRFISPYKGYRCAYSVYHQADSCSSAVVNILSNQDISLTESVQAVRSRFKACQEAHAMYQINKDWQPYDPPYKITNVCAFDACCGD